MQGGEIRSNTHRYATSSCYEGSQMATGSHRPDFTSSPCWQLKKLAPQRRNSTGAWNWTLSV